MTIDRTEADITAAAERLKMLADTLATKLETAGPYATDTPTQQYLARLAVYVVRQVHAICFLVALPYYAEQVGQLVRGLAEATRIGLWLDQPDDEDERLRRAIVFFKDGVTQMADKIAYYEIHSDVPYDEEQTALLLERQEQIDNLENEMETPALSMPSAKQMLEDLDLQAVYSLFRWESDASHASSIALGQTVSFETATNSHLGGPNKPWDRVRRIGATLLLLQYAGDAIFRGLGFDTNEWNATATAAEEDIQNICGPYYTELDGEAL